MWPLAQFIEELTDEALVGYMGATDSNNVYNERSEDSLLTNR